jgi:phosphate starvation-inducible PhoH-like protein
VKGILGSDHEESVILPEEVIMHGVKGNVIKTHSVHQKELVESINAYDLIIASGPAGTGKTYTAVTMAVKYLKEKQVRKIILTRPAVEAGENLGFLPGDLKDKMDPYLQPLYDALHDMIPYDKLIEYLQSGTIQIAPLAYMRGRTLDHAFVILDEAQNATQSQFKMFVTRMGKSAKFVVTGDVSQIDLKDKKTSGLLQAMNLLGKLDEVKIVQFDEKDVMRHPLVKKIIKAYEE